MNILLRDFYINNLNKMVNENELNEYRTMIQQIIDRHLPVEKRFSVKDFSQEDLYYLASLLLAKDEEERDKIRKEINNKHKEAHKELVELVEDIKAHKDKYDTLFNSIDDVNSLKLDIDLSNEL